MVGMNHEVVTLGTCMRENLLFSLYHLILAFSLNPEGRQDCHRENKSGELMARPANWP